MSETELKSQVINALFEAALDLREQAREVSHKDQNLADAMEAGAMALATIWCAWKDKEEDEMKDYQRRAIDACVQRAERLKLNKN
jgi:hypothetical protein